MQQGIVMVSSILIMESPDRKVPLYVKYGMLLAFQVKGKWYNGKYCSLSV